MQKRKNWLLLLVIAILIGVIVWLSVIAFGKKDATEQKTNKEIEIQTDETRQEATKSDAQKETTTQQSQDNQEDTQTASDNQGAQNVTMVMSNSWEGQEGYYAQFDATISNQTSSAIKDWEIQVSVPEKTKIDSSWNGNFSIKDGKLSITAVDYNKEVAANASQKDIGVILIFSSKADADSISGAAQLLVNGTVQKAEAAQTTTQEEKTQTTEAVKPAEKPQTESGTPFEVHGKLSVKGVDLVDQNGDPYQLKGISTHGLAWFPQYVNQESFQSLRDDFGANVVRLAMYSGENNGYCTGGDKEKLKSLVKDGVEYATKLGMYVIIDWHVLGDKTPQTYKEEAKIFFDEMAKTYQEYDNVIYEICNEPNGGTTWEEVKSYAEEVVPVIRQYAKESIIIIGTPNWSQDVDIAAQNPVTGYDNLMYAIHFYAATHTDSIRSKVTTALDNGLPVIVSEFSICDASGNGAIDYDQADRWFSLIDDKNLSYVAWNLSNKDETSSLISAGCTKTSGWTEEELSETGKWLKNQIQSDK